MAVSEQKEMEAIKADLATLRKDVAALTDKVKEWGVEEARLASRAVTQEIETHPLASVMSAFTLGLIVDRILRRSGL